MLCKVVQLGRDSIYLPSAAFPGLNFLYFPEFVTTCFNDESLSKNNLFSLKERIEFIAISKRGFMVDNLFDHHDSNLNFEHLHLV